MGPRRDQPGMDEPRSMIFSLGLRRLLTEALQAGERALWQFERAISQDVANRQESHIGRGAGHGT